MSDDMSGLEGFVVSLVMIFFITCLIAAIVLSIEMHSAEKRLDAVGIKEIRECRIDTPTCHSNWYEIVWKDGVKK